MKFIKQAIKLPDNSLSKVIKENMQGMERHRGFKHIHASDLTKPDFCPREVCLVREHDIPLKKEYIDCARRLTFDVGNATAQLIAERWAGQSAIGNWVCRSCGTSRTFTRHPEKCKCSPYSSWEYKELNFVHVESKASGNIDLIIDLEEPKYRLVELKIIKPEDFADIVAPLAEHKARTSLYLSIVKQSNNAYKDRVNTEEGIVCYVSRGYGKKVEGLGVLPFKEYRVKRDEDNNAPYFDRARSITMYEEKQADLPARICSDSGCTRAKKCSAAETCFSLSE